MLHLVSWVHSLLGGAINISRLLNDNLDCSADLSAPCVRGRHVRCARGLNTQSDLVWRDFQNLMIG